MTDILSAMAGLSLTLFGVLAAIAFFPTSMWWKHSSYKYLNLGIFLIALTAVGNAIYWGPINQFGVRWGLLTVEQVRGPFGDFVDLVMKGGAAVAFYLQLYALREQLPEHIRKHWTVLEIAFYPRRLQLLDKLLRKVGLK